MDLGTAAQAYGALIGLDVRFGSIADFSQCNRHPLYPESGHLQCTSRCPLWANSGHCQMASLIAKPNDESETWFYKDRGTVMHLFIETYRGTVGPADCDDLGHMNVQHYFAAVSNGSLQ
jgi:hypothetical protein